MKQLHSTPDPEPLSNPQTEALCQTLGIDDPMALLKGSKPKPQSDPKPTSSLLTLHDSLPSPKHTAQGKINPDEVDLDDLDDDDEDEDFVVDKSGDAAPEPEPVPDQSPAKKLKRRNVSLYKEDESD